MNVLVLAPHPDDEAIGCGGTVCKHTARDDWVTAVFLTSGEAGLKHLAREDAWNIREREARVAAKILALDEIIFLRGPDWTVGKNARMVAARLKPVLEREKPGLIYLPHPQEWHPDHAATLKILRLALRGRNSFKPQLLGYEVWTPLQQFDRVEDITPMMPRKLRAVRAHRSQVNQIDYAGAVRGLNAYRGALSARSRFAEVFQTVRLRE